MKYAVVYEKSANGYAAYVPHLPGCIAVGDTLQETKKLIQEAVAFHSEGLRVEHFAVPPPTSECEYISID